MSPLYSSFAASTRSGRLVNIMLPLLQEKLSSTALQDDIVGQIVRYLISTARAPQQTKSEASVICIDEKKRLL